MERTMNRINLSVTTLLVNRSSHWDKLKRYLIEWRNRSRSRWELRTLGEHDLWDVGITRGAAEFEASKPFWRD
jgi:uncharacterized protein YjiS (DUF1127 family)